MSIGLEELDASKQQAGGSETGAYDAPSLSIDRFMELDAQTLNVDFSGDARFLFRSSSHTNRLIAY